MTLIAKAADAFLGDLSRIGRTPRTIATYRRVLDRLADKYPHHDIEQVTASLLREFLDEYTYSRRTGGRTPNRPATVAQTVSVVRQFFRWLYEEGEISRNPAERLRRPKLEPAHLNDNVVTVSTADVGLLLRTADAMGWPERLAVYLAVYSGARRHALAQLRRSDYDPFERTLRFHEKGRKEPCVPIADELADLLDAAIVAGLYETDDAYLIPAEARQRRTGERDDRIVWRLVGRVADRAYVRTTVHALRAAFAVFYLEQGLGDVYDLKEQLGHSRLDTTEVYLRRRNRRRSLESVRRMDWGKASNAALDANPLTEKEGFEPSFDAKSIIERDGTHREAPDHG